MYAPSWEGIISIYYQYHYMRPHGRGLSACIIIRTLMGEDSQHTRSFPFYYIYIYIYIYMYLPVYG